MNQRLLNLVLLGEPGHNYENISLVNYALTQAAMSYTVDNLEEENSLWQFKENESEFPLIVSLVRLRKYKKIQDLIRSMTLVLKEIPDAQLHIMRKGDYDGELVDLTKSLRLE